MTLPTWLEETPTTKKPIAAMVTTRYAKTREELTLMELTYENFFETAIDRIALGHQLTEIIADDPRDISLVDYMKWVKQDKTRKKRVKEAEEIAAEILVMQTPRIAEGIDNPMEDIQRSTLRVNNNWRIASALYPEKFGKNAGMTPVNAGMGGGITINIGTVESPYTVDSTPNTPASPTTHLAIEDVESRSSDN